MISKLRHLSSRQIFYPSWLGVFTNPFFIARAGLRDAMLEFSPLLNGCLLDVGCGTKPYKELFDVDTYVGLDLDSDESRRKKCADKLYDGEVFPFADGEFDSVLCNQVLEHVFNPDKFLEEVRRVLRPGGKLLLTIPFVWDEHEQPFDYARYSSYGLTSLLKKNGFAVIEQKKINDDVSVIFQLINAYCYKIISSYPRFIRLIITGSVIAFFNILSLVLRHLLPKNPDLFLDQVVLAEKVN